VGDKGVIEHVAEVGRKGERYRTEMQKGINNEI